MPPALSDGMAAASSSAAVHVVAAVAKDKAKEKDKAKASEQSRMSQLKKEVADWETRKGFPLSKEARDEKMAELAQYAEKLPPKEAAKLRKFLEEQATATALHKHIDKAAADVVQQVTVAVDAAESRTATRLDVLQKSLEPVLASSTGPPPARAEGESIDEFKKKMDKEILDRKCAKAEAVAKERADKKQERADAKAKAKGKVKADAEAADAPPKAKAKAAAKAAPPAAAAAPAVAAAEAEAAPHPVPVQPPFTRPTLVPVEQLSDEQLELLKGLGLSPNGVAVEMLELINTTLATDRKPKEGKAAKAKAKAKDGKDSGSSSGSDTEQPPQQQQP